MLLLLLRERRATCRRFMSLHLLQHSVLAAFVARTHTESTTICRNIFAARFVVTGRRRVRRGAAQVVTVVNKYWKSHRGS